MKDLACLAILLGSGGLFAITFTRGITTGHALLNTESATALSFFLLAFARSRGDDAGQRDDGPSHYFIAALAIFCTIPIIYRGVFGTPFVFDDYTHITDAGNWTWRTALSAFGPSTHKPGLFFRPLSFVAYWLNYLWAGTDAQRWHLSSIVLHSVNSCLLYGLCRSLGLGQVGSLGAAFLFALNASSVEAIAWIDAIFDPMAAFFVLASLLSVCRFLESGRSAWLLATLTASAFAAWSKESAFCFPLLAACLWFFRPKAERRRLWITCGWLTALALALFGYRWWAIGGMGGYRNAGGELDIGRFHLVRALNAILMRDWTVLFFPVNWSLPLNPLLRVFLLSTPIALAAIAWWARIPRRALAGSIALTVVAALPVYHLLLIGTDLGDSRRLYLLSIGWAVLWGCLFSAIAPGMRRYVAIGWMLTLHLLMVNHNLKGWLTVPEEARQVCAEFARTYGTAGSPATVIGLPQKKNGVVFLANGFPECVELNKPFPRSTVQMEQAAGATFVWNEAKGRVEPAP